MNKKHKIDFIINDTEKISIIMEETTLQEIHCCSETIIFFVQNRKKYLLDYGTLRFNLDFFSQRLAAVISGQLLLHSSIKDKIGELYAKFNLFYLGNDKANYNDPEVVFEENNKTFWVGEKYFIWGKKFALWIYNLTDGSIILELTPCFQGPYESKSEFQNIVIYEKWIENYKPLLKRIIPKEVALQWLEQIEMILDQIEKNIVRMQKEYDDKR